jgi:hypothetical protein
MNGAASLERTYAGANPARLLLAMAWGRHDRGRGWAASRGKWRKRDFRDEVVSVQIGVAQASG